MLKQIFPADFLLILSVCLTAFVTFGHAHYNSLHLPEDKRFIRHFRWAFVFFFVIPLISWLLITGNVKALGFIPEQTLPWWLVVGGTLLVIAIGFFSSKDKALSAFYPFARNLLAGDQQRNFIKYELNYLLFYYVGWEFFFRQMMIAPFMDTNPWVGIAIGTMATTLLHIGHPKSEIWGALLAGPIFGYICYYTNSFLYPLYFHALTGMSLDYFVFRSKRR